MENPMIPFAVIPHYYFKNFCWYKYIVPFGYSELGFILNGALQLNGNNVFWKWGQKTESFVDVDGWTVR